MKHKTRMKNHAYCIDFETHANLIAEKTFIHKCIY